MKQLYYGKATRRFKIGRCMGLYLEKVKVNGKTVTHPLLMLRFLHVGDTRLTVFPSLPNGKNFFDSSVEYGELSVKAHALAEKLSHLWANVGCVIQVQEKPKEGFIYITRTNVPTLDQLLDYTKPISTSVKVDRETLPAFYKVYYKTASSLKRSLTRAFAKIEREASALVQEFLKEITHMDGGVALFKKLEKNEYDVAKEEIKKAKKPSKAKPKKFSTSAGGAALVLRGVGAVGVARSTGKGKKNNMK